MLSNNIYLDIKKDIHNILFSDHTECIIPLYTKIFNKKILVLSGGGIKGIAHIGSLQYLYDHNYINNFEIFAGTSIGALIIVLYVIGYMPSDIWDFIKTFDFTQIVNLNIANFCSHYGVDDGHNFELVIFNLIEAKGINPHITLLDLFYLTHKKIILTTVCLNTHTSIYLSHDTTPNLPLIIAIRMSTCIPIYFSPIIYDDITGSDKNKKYMYIDGGCIDNYPIHLFNNNLDQVLGIYLCQSSVTTDIINGIDHYILLILETLMNGCDFNSKKGYSHCTIDILVGAVCCIDFSIDLPIKEIIYRSGYDSTKLFFSRF